MPGLQDALNSAKRLMTPEADKVLNARARAEYGNGGGQINENMEYVLPPQYTTTPQSTNIPRTYRGDGTAGQKLPAAIRESLMSNPLDPPPNSLNGSVLDMVIPRQQQTPTPMTIPVVSENRQIISGGSSIDYGVIKSLIDESVRRHIDELKGTLTENTKKGNNSLGVMKLGEKFQFLDNKGNLYEAQMKFIKNINKK